MKKVNFCPFGGYTQFMMKLIGGAQIKCPVCAEFLSSNNFDQNEFNAFMTDWLEGDRETIIQMMKLPELQECEKKPPQSQDGKQPAEGSAAEGSAAKKDDAGEDREKALAYLASVQPTISLLGPGTHGKRLPYRCNLCRSARHPDGKIGELSELRYSCVKTFVGNHLKSISHTQALRKASQPPKCLKRVDCSGLSINDPRANQLFFFQEEFKLWASMANFEGMARHKYIHNANLDAWIIFSNQCLTQVDVDDDSAHHVCQKCLDLGLSHSVAGLRLESGGRALVC